LGLNQSPVRSGLLPVAPTSSRGAVVERSRAKAIGIWRAWVQVGTLIDRAYVFATFQGDDVIISPTFPGLKLTAAEVLRAGR
jgi:hypothetical protein